MYIYIYVFFHLGIYAYMCVSSKHAELWILNSALFTYAVYLLPFFVSSTLSLVSPTVSNTGLTDCHIYIYTVQMRIGDGNIHECAFKAGSMPARPDRGQETALQKSRQGRCWGITRRADVDAAGSIFFFRLVGEICCTGHVIHVWSTAHGRGNENRHFAIGQWHLGIPQW